MYLETREEWEIRSERKGSGRTPNGIVTGKGPSAWGQLVVCEFLTSCRKNFKTDDSERTFIKAGDVKQERA